MVRIVEQEGRVAPAATPQIKASRYMGSAVVNPVRLNMAPADAFGDASGTAAIGQAMMNAGDMLFDVAQREVALDKAKEQSDLEAGMTQYSFNYDKAAKDIEDEEAFLEVPRTADEKIAEVERRAGEARRALFDGKEYKYYSDEFVQRTLDEVHQDKMQKYRVSDTIENTKRSQVIIGTNKQSSALIQGATLAGEKGEVTKLNDIIGGLNSLYNDPKNRAALGPINAEKFRLEGIQQALTEFVSTYAQDNPEAALALLSAEDSPIRTMLSEEEMLMINSDLTKIVKQAQAQKEEDTRKWQGENAGRLERYIYTPDAKGRHTSYAGLKRAVESGEITDDQYSTLFRMKRGEDDRWEAKNAERKASGNEQSMFMAVLDAGGSFNGVELTDTQETNIYKGIIGRVDAVVKAAEAEGKSPAELNQLRDDLTAGLISKAGIMPDPYKALVEGQIRSADPEVANRAARNIKIIMEQNPQAAASFSPNAQHAAVAASLGGTPEEVRTAANGAYNMTTSTVQGIKTDTETYMKSEDSKADLQKWAKQNLQYKGELPSSLNSEYSEAFKTAMVQTNGDVAKSKALAQQKLSERWGKTAIDGSERVMYKPPELMYGARGEMVDIMREQVEKTASARGLREGQYTLQLDPTWRQKSPDDPAVYIMYQDVGGVWQPVLDKRTGQTAKFAWDKKQLSEELIKRQRTRNDNVRKQTKEMMFNPNTGEFYQQ